MSEDEFQNAFKNSKPFKDNKEIRKENRYDDEIIRDLKSLYEAKEDYYKPRKIKGAFGGNYIEYEGNGNIDEVSSIEDYLNKIRPYLSDIIDKHKDGRKIQLVAEITFLVLILSICTVGIYFFYIRFFFSFLISKLKIQSKI